jgi:hypothetical protein
LRTKITGKIVVVGDDHVTLEVGAFEYEVLIPDFVRRRLQGQLGNEVALHTIEYLEGNPAQGRLTPRLVGFQSIVERQFFEMFCSVDGVGSQEGSPCHGAAGAGCGLADRAAGRQGPGNSARNWSGHGRADYCQTAAKNVAIRFAGHRGRADERRTRLGMLCATPTNRC